MLRTQQYIQPAQTAITQQLDISTLLDSMMPLIMMMMMMMMIMPMMKSMGEAFKA